MTNKVKDYRRRLGITQKTLAETSQIGQATISEIENQKYIPRADTAIRIARALNTTVENLFIVDDYISLDNSDFSEYTIVKTNNRLQYL